MRSRQSHAGSTRFYINRPLFPFSKSQLLPIVDATIMISIVVFLFAFSSITIVSTLTLNNTLLILPGSTVTNVTSSNYIYHCDGTAYGYSLDIASCTEALDQMAHSSTIEQTYGPRSRGPFDVKLPKRYISCSFSQSLVAPCGKMASLANHSLADRGWTLHHRTEYHTWCTLRSCKFARSRIRSRQCPRPMCKWVDNWRDSARYR